MKLTEKQEKARKMVCLPLDGLQTLDALEERVEELSQVVGLFKIGKESYTRFGPKAVEIVQEKGSDVFLDLKYHDIPNTVKGAANAAAQLGVYMFNVHASGGVEMMRAAKKGAEEGAEKYGTQVPKITAVTILTSIDDEILKNELGYGGDVQYNVLNLAKLANSAGLDGVVCSATDLHGIRDKLPKDFMYVTPGIKGPNTPAGKDQKISRVFTPGNAVQDGSNILVVGRAITDPRTDEQKKAGIMVTPGMRVQAGYEVLEDMAKYL